MYISYISSTAHVVLFLPPFHSILAAASPTVHKPNTRSDCYLFRVFPSSLSFIFFKAIRGNPFMMNSSNPAYQNLLRIEKKVETDTNKSTI